jgi:hypothetical protein
MPLLTKGSPFSGCDYGTRRSRRCDGREKQNPEDYFGKLREALSHD